MASALALMSLWAAICTRDPEHPGCTLRPGQCYETSTGVQVCARPPKFPDLPEESDGKPNKD
jgi:hypothetical protein